MHAFSETDKLAYMGESDDSESADLYFAESFALTGVNLLTDKMFYFTCFNVDDPDDPSVGLINGELAIPGNLLRREVFDPVVDQVRARPI